ncbi:MAG: response regulator, partial [Myxococcota bacterium]
MSRVIVVDMTADAEVDTPMSHPRPTPFRLLLVDDEPMELQLLRRTLGQMDTEAELEWAPGGVEALRMLEGAPDALPHVILVDLNMQGMSGIQLLETLVAHATLSTIPVMIYSTSSAPHDIDASYARGASCYIVKPFDIAGLEVLFRSILMFWGRWVAYPTPQRRASTSG